MQEIFISYRRNDSQDAVGRIHDHVDLYFGQNIAFRDIDDIKGGTNFHVRVETALQSCRLVLAVIGPKWLNARNSKGRRLDDPDDLVRVELRTALERKVPVIPVLVSFAAMPSRDQLPADIADLSYVNSVAVPPDYSFPGRMRELVERIRELTDLPYGNYLDLLRQSQKIGLITIKDNFAGDRTELAELASTRDLFVIMNDGRSWIRAHGETLRGRINDTSKRTRVVLLHPRSDFIDILVRKNRKTRSQQIEDIRSSFQALRIAPVRPELLDVRGHHGFNPFTLILADDHAFVSPYMFNERGALPLMKYSGRVPGGLYEQLRQDAEILFQNSETLTEDDFVRALSIKASK